MKLRKSLQAAGLTTLEKAALEVAVRRYGEDEGYRIEARRSRIWQECLSHVQQTGGRDG